MVRVIVEVQEVRGKCALGYQQGDQIILKDFYIEYSSKPICLHALASMLTILILMLKQHSGRELGLSKSSDEAYVQCPDPNGLLTDGGTVIFRIRRSTNH
ncbi:MAG: TIGR04076 family protein [Desulfurococcaceae archaeon]|uniref:TIGR04076 family protein n=1 Tax=Staphylothermus marinus TaxID=2280 RepID=A0A7C4HC16_STAMA